MSQVLWGRFHCFFEGVHRQVALQRPLLAAPQGYLCRQGAHARLVGEDPDYPCPFLQGGEEVLQHVRCAYSRAVGAGVAQVG